MDGNNNSFENFERNKYLKKLPSMQRVKVIHVTSSTILWLIWDSNMTRDFGTTDKEQINN